MSVNGATMIKADIVNDLFNSIFTNQTKKPAIKVFDANEFLSKMYKKYESPDEVKFDPAYVNIFLERGNNKIKNLAMEIVDKYDSDDVKMEKIQKWVVDNVEYTPDKTQYGYDELWATPTMTARSKKGDCEDGAFLIMSLALNAGVNPNNLQFYGGEVKAGEGAATGGHGWVAYKRSSDRQWVPVDFSYYPDLRDMDERKPMKDDLNYIRQYFIFNVNNIITSDANRVRQPTVYTNNGLADNLFPGKWLSQYA